MKRIGYFQFRPILGDPEANRETIADALEEVKADLIVLPELAFTGYSMTNRKTVSELAEDPADSLSIDMLDTVGV